MTAETIGKCELIGMSRKSQLHLAVQNLIRTHFIVEEELGDYPNHSTHSTDQKDHLIT